MDLAFSPDFYYHQNATFCTLLMAKLEFRQKRYPNLKCSSENGCFETETGAEIGEISSTYSTSWRLKPNTSNFKA